MIEITTERIITIKIKYEDMKKLLREIEKIGMLQRANDIKPELHSAVLVEMYDKMRTEE